MKTLERRYSKSERIIAKAKFSAAAYLWCVLLAVLLGGAIAAVWAFNDEIERVFTKSDAGAQAITDEVMRWVLLGAGVFVLLCFVAQALSLYGKELIVTEDKVVYRSGFLSMQNTAIPLVEIRIIETHQSFLQRILNVGTVVIVSDAEKPYKIKGVKAADRFTRRIMKQVTTVKRENESRSVRLQLTGYSKKK